MASRARARPGWSSRSRMLRRRPRRPRAPPASPFGVWRTARPCGDRRSPSAVLEEALVAQLAECAGLLLELAEAHPVEHRLRLGELDVLVGDDLDQVPPGIPKVEPAAG